MPLSTCLYLADITFFALGPVQSLIQVHLDLVQTLVSLGQRRLPFGLQLLQVFVSRSPDVGPQLLATLRRKQQGDDGPDGRA
jgi:hypothetical protein